MFAEESCTFEAARCDDIIQGIDPSILRQCSFDVSKYINLLLGCHANAAKIRPCRGPAFKVSAEHTVQSQCNHVVNLRKLRLCNVVRLLDFS